MYNLEQQAKRIRANCVKMSYSGQEGHLGSALSCVDILVALYSQFDFNPSNADRDRLYFSKGHACSALYATMAEFGIMPEHMLETYTKPGSPLTPHPDRNLFPFLEMSSGSLGHGLGIAAGAAYALKQRQSKAKCIVLMGDGECNEGSVWEAAQFATAHKLHNLIAVVDYNRIQSIGRTDEISGYTLLERKFEAFGWQSEFVDGHDFQAMFEAIYTASNKPLTIVAETTAGKGVSFMEAVADTCLWHYRIPSTDEVEKALEELNG